MPDGQIGGAGPSMALGLPRSLTVPSRRPTMEGWQGRANSPRFVRWGPRAAGFTSLLPFWALPRQTAPTLFMPSPPSFEPQPLRRAGAPLSVAWPRRPTPLTTAAIHRRQRDMATPTKAIRLNGGRQRSLPRVGDRKTAIVESSRRVDGTAKTVGSARDANEQRRGGEFSEGRRLSVRNDGGKSARLRRGAGVRDAADERKSVERLSWGTLDALTGQALVVVGWKPRPATASGTREPREIFVVRKLPGESLGLAGSARVAPDGRLLNVTAFAYDIVIRRASEFDAASFATLDDTTTTATLADVAARRARGHGLSALALQLHLVGMQVRAGRLAVAPPDRRPDRDTFLVLEPLASGTGSRQELAAVVALDGQRIVGGITNGLSLVALAQPVPVAQLRDRVAGPVCFLWASDQLSEWLASGRAARRPSRVSPTTLFSLLPSL